VVRHIAWERVSGIVAAVIVGVALTKVDAAWSLLAVVVILVGTIAAEMLRLREARTRIRADGPPT
jgi:hypothetical protein